MAGSGKDVEAVYRMLYPKPKPLLQYCRELVRHGELIYFSPNTNSTKPRYFFLFDTALLLTKRTGKKRYWLKVYVHLRNGVTLVDNGPTDTQFRYRPPCPTHTSHTRALLPHPPPSRSCLTRPDMVTCRLMVTVKGRTRPIIMYGKNQQHKELWVRDLKHVLWAANGKKGPDPSADSSSPAGGKRTQQPSAADRTSGKDSKSQRSGAGNSSGERTLYYQDAEDDFDEDDQREEDDSGDEEDEVEFMNVKKDDRRTQNMTNQDSGATGSNQQEVERLAHGLDSLVFDPFSDFIPPHASASVTTSPSYSVPSSTLATFPPVGAYRLLVWHGEQFD